ncbi:MAG TPA: glycerate kinase, partial [Longimicrobiales bacterium]|nr:glycerate kinase [Longimicrobiales bacterium]
GARAVVTGEGAWDAQSSMGKVTGEVVSRARAAGVPVLVVAGRIDGALPDGVAGSTADEVLDADALARLAGRGLAGLLARHRRP